MVSYWEVFSSLVVFLQLPVFPIALYDPCIDLYHSLCRHILLWSLFPSPYNRNISSSYHLVVFLQGLMTWYAKHFFPTVNIIQFAFNSHATSQLDAVFSFPNWCLFSYKVILANTPSTNYANSDCICFFFIFSTFIAFHNLSLNYYQLAIKIETSLLFMILFKYLFCCPIVMISPSHPQVTYYNVIMFLCQSIYLYWCIIGLFLIAVFN